MYTPPELLVGKPFTAHGDVYALGVLLFQMVVGDLTRPIGPGSLRDVTDDLLRQDISDCIDVDPDDGGSQAPGNSPSCCAPWISGGADRKRLADAAIAVQKRKRMAVLAMVLLIISAIATIVTVFFAASAAVGARQRRKGHRRTGTCRIGAGHRRLQSRPRPPPRLPMRSGRVIRRPSAPPPRPSIRTGWNWPGNGSTTQPPPNTDGKWGLSARFKPMRVLSC